MLATDLSGKNMAEQQTPVNGTDTRKGEKDSRKNVICSIGVFI